MISAPRRFGKSVNLGVSEKFSEVVVDEEEKRIIKEETVKYLRS